MKKRILYQLLDDEFTKFGDKFMKIAHNEANGMYCYKRTTSEKCAADKIAFYMANGFEAGRYRA